MMKKYTVKQLAKLVDVSVRTLHHYDEVDLLKPAFVGENGYRYYEHDQLLKLVQILFYRELEFSLEEIKRIVDDADFDMGDALEKQKKMLELKNKRTKRLIKTIDQIIESMKGGENMNTTQVSTSFDKSEMDKYKDEVKQRWGHTEAYRQSMERTKKWSKEDFEKIKKEGMEITVAISELMDLEVSDARVQELIEKHHVHIGRFYDCSKEMYRGLGEMYFADPRFAKFYEDVKPGLAEFMSRAIGRYCEKP